MHPRICEGLGCEIDVLKCPFKSEKVTGVGSGVPSSPCREEPGPKGWCPEPLMSGWGAPDGETIFRILTLGLKTWGVRLWRARRGNHFQNLDFGPWALGPASAPLGPPGPQRPPAGGRPWALGPQGPPEGLGAAPPSFGFSSSSNVGSSRGSREDFATSVRRMGWAAGKPQRS